jgi:hypothetical protein
LNGLIQGTKVTFLNTFLYYGQNCYEDDEAMSLPVYTK